MPWSYLETSSAETGAESRAGTDCTGLRQIKTPQSAEHAHGSMDDDVAHGSMDDDVAVMADEFADDAMARRWDDDIAVMGIDDADDAMARKQNDEVNSMEARRQTCSSATRTALVLMRIMPARIMRKCRANDVSCSNGQDTMDDSTDKTRSAPCTVVAAETH